MVTVIRNVGGVQGLHLALDAFSEDIERRLFENSVLFLPAAVSATKSKRHGRPTGPPIWNDDIWKMSTRIQEIFPNDLVQPNYCLGLSYNKSVGFNAHFDSRTRWGEAIVGVSLGQASVMYFQPDKKKFAARVAPTINAANNNGNGVLQVDSKHYDSGSLAVEVQLPRRSIYIMSGESRYDWKHGIRQQTAKRLEKEFPAPPSWNPYNLRRSMTFRATKAYSDAFLEHAEKNASNQTSKERLSLRIAQQNIPKFKPSRNGERLNKEALETLRKEETAEMHSVLRHPFYGASFGSLDQGGQETATAVGRTLVGSADNDNFEQQLQMAIRMSLENEAGPREYKSNQTKKQGAAGVDADVIVLDDSDDEEENKKPAAKTTATATKGEGGQPGATITTIDDDDDDDDDVLTEEKDAKTKKRPAPEASKEDEQERIRLARLRRFG